MFSFSVQQDTIKVEPRDFDDPLEAIRLRVNTLYADRIIENVGLVISLLDFVDVGEGVALYADGCLYYAVVFRLLVFRPTIGETLVGRVDGQDESCVRVTVGFFDKITIPRAFLPDNVAFDNVRQAFFWIYQPDPALVNPPLAEEDIEDDRLIILTNEQLANYPHTRRFYIERGKWIRFKIEEEIFRGTSHQRVVDDWASESPYQLSASISDEGMGLLEWYD